MEQIAQYEWSVMMYNVFLNVFLMQMLRIDIIVTNWMNDEGWARWGEKVITMSCWCAINTSTRIRSLHAVVDSIQIQTHSASHCT